MKKLIDGITAFMGLLWILSACAVDSDSWLPSIICLITSLWLGVYAYKTDKLGGDC